MKRALKITGAVVALLVLVVVAALWYVAGTNSGLRWALGVAERSTAGKIAVGDSQGNLLRGVELHDLRYRDTGLELQIAQVRLRWGPLALLHGTLQIKTLYARDVRIRTRPTDEPAQPSTFPPQIQLPIGVALDEAVVDGLRLTQNDQPPVVVERIELGGAVRGDRFRIAQLSVRTAQLQASAQGRLQLSGDYSMDVSLDWSLQHAGERWQGQGSIAGDRNKLRVGHELHGPLDAELNARIDDVFDSTRWQAQLDVPTFDADRVLRNVLAGGNSASPDAEWPALGQVRIEARLHGDRSRAVLDPLRLEMPRGDRSATLTGRIEQLQAATPRADLTLEWSQLQWPLQGDAQLASDQGKAQFAGWLEQFDLKLNAGFAAPTGGETPARFVLSAQASSDGSTLQIGQLQARQVEGPGALQLHGTVRQWRTATPQFDVDANWQTLQWPLQGEAQYASTQGSARLQGDLDQYGFRADAQVGGVQLPKGQWRLEGNGDRNHAEVRTLAAEVLKGHLDGNASLAWQNALQWQASLQFRQLDPGEFDPAWHGSLSGAVRSNGRLGDQGPAFELTVSDLQGTLRERSFRADAELKRADQRLLIQRLAVRAGDARLNASGSVGERIDLQWKLDAEHLADLLPEASGSLRSSGSLQGTLQQPQVQLTLTGKEPRWQDYGAGSVDVSAKGGIAPSQTLDLDVQVTSLTAPGIEAEQLSVTGTGNSGQHQIRIALKQIEGSVKAELAGGLNDQSVWKGTLRRLEIQRDRIGAWTLQQPTPLTVAADHAGIDNACLQRDQAALCGSGTWRAQQGWSAQTALRQFPLSALAELLPEGVRLTGTLNGTADVTAGSTGLSKADAQLQLSPGELRYQVDAERTIEERFEGGSMQVRQQQGRLVGSLQIALAGSDRIDGQASVDLPANTGGDWSNSQLRGSLNLRMARMQVVEVFVPQVSGVKGNLQAQLSLAGRVGRPELSGEARLRAEQLELPQLGTTIKDLDLKVADAGGGALQLRGSAQSGGGSLRLDGRFEPEGGNPWLAQLRVTGDRFLAARNAEATVYISPDLQVKAKPKRIDLEGSLTVPEAHLTPREGRSAVKPSSDVVVVREDQPKTQQEAGWSVYAHLNLKLGDKVRFTGYGFDGRVSGALVLNDVPNKVTTATGSVNIDDASYTAYGKTLNVDRGRLTFSGNPVTNPGLDLVATRTVDDKRVGVIVSGTASNPTLELFSNPTMSEGDILAYLVLGRPLNSAGEADKGALMAAASSFGLAKGSALAESIGHQLGFEDVSVSRGGDSNQPWLTVGRYLSPKLYVSYGVGLFEPGNLVRVRYELTKHWKVQGESGGSSSGADLLYTIER